MSLAIDVDKITGILIGNEWYTVADNSFDCDAYEFIHEGKTIASLKSESTGFTFKLLDSASVHEYSVGGWISGPLSAIRAVRCSK